MIIDVYLSHRCPESKSHNFTPRLFELSSATGEFTANEVLFSARSNEVEAYPFQQSDLYSAIQPGVSTSLRIIVCTHICTVCVGLE